MKYARFCVIKGDIVMDELFEKYDRLYTVAKAIGDTVTMNKYSILMDRLQDVIIDEGELLCTKF
jgi:hypothetical protein